MDRYSYDRSETLSADLDRSRGETPEGTVTKLLQTYAAGTYPIVAQRVYACRPVSVSASPTEGSTPTYAADSTRTIYAANLGNSIPEIGARVLGTNESGVWTFRYDG